MSADHVSSESPAPHAESMRDGRPLPANAVFAFALLTVCTASGGLILGVGAFGSKLSPRYVISEDLQTVFDGGFQIMTWSTLLWSLAHDRLGPRFCAVVGLLMAGCGNAIIGLAAAQGSSSPYIFMLGYGLVGGGGNGPYVAAYQFAHLFERQGLRCTVLSAGFNVAGYVYLVLNISSVSLVSFFGLSALYTATLGLCTLVVFPDTPYARNDRCVAQQLPRRWRCDWWWSPTLTLAPCCAFIKQPRFIGFCCTFGWCTMVNIWVGGAVFSVHPDVSGPYLFWGYPLITNATFVLTPLLGPLIDAAGFTIPAIVLIASTQACLLCLWLPGVTAAWLMLIFFLLVQASAFCLEFAFLTMAFPPNAYPGLLAVTLLCQGLLGFIAWPFLSDLGPFGNAWTGDFLILSIPTMFLYYWPWVQWRDDERLAVEGVLQGTTCLPWLQQTPTPAVPRAALLASSMDAPVAPSESG